MKSSGEFASEVFAVYAMVMFSKVDLSIVFLLSMYSAMAVTCRYSIRGAAGNSNMEFAEPEGGEGD